MTWKNIITHQTHGEISGTESIQQYEILSVQVNTASAGR